MGHAEEDGQMTSESSASVDNNMRYIILWDVVKYRCAGRRMLHRVICRYILPVSWTAMEISGHTNRYQETYTMKPQVDCVRLTSEVKYSLHIINLIAFKIIHNLLLPSSNPQAHIASTAKPTAHSSGKPMGF